MKTILIPTDFSDSARNAFDFALKLFGEDNKFILLNTYEEPRSTTSSMISLRDILHESSVDSLREAEYRVREVLGLKGIQLDTYSEYGDPVHAIANFARNDDLKVDLIVMGTTGASGLKEIIIGSVASAVIQNSPVPVMAVPINYKPEAPKRILFASDLSELDGSSLPEVFMDIDRVNKAEITILTVNKEHDIIDVEKAEVGYDLHIQMQELNHRFEVIESENIELGIEEYARVNDMQMLVTIPKQSTWFHRLVNPSLSKKLAQHIDIPMLALSK
ncbi:MAG: universal stress protein [Flavobacteriales bacterium]|nr:universal stress protein [Flavobacteriales bacterium]